MREDSSADEWERRWLAHIDELKRVRLAVDEADHIAMIDENIQELRDIVKETAEDYDE